MTFPPCRTGAGSEVVLQATQIVGLVKPPEPAAGSIGKHIGSPADREGNGRRTGPSPEQPRKHTKKVPSSFNVHREAG
jgi:hypothetical protein